MNSDDLTIRVLTEIRDEVRATNVLIDRTNERVDHLGNRVDHFGERLDFMRDDLGRRIVESELRTATAITELHGTLRDIHTYLTDRGDLRDRVDRCERDIDEIKRRVG